jgi:hypothetical protein
MNNYNIPSVYNPGHAPSVVGTPGTAANVANVFLVKYYTMLHQSPQSLFHFYKDNSVLTHGNEDLNEEETVYGKEVSLTTQSKIFLQILFVFILRFKSRTL